MAVQAFKFYDQAKHYIGDGTIDLSGDTFDLHLFQSASDFATDTQSTLSQLSGEVASANNYTTAGKQMTTTWSAGASSGEQRFDATADVVVTASGGDISNIKAAVVVARTGASAKDGANKLLCYASLTSSQFNLTSGNTLTLQIPSGGIFELN